MKTKHYLLPFLLLISVSVWSQKMEGTVTYEKTYRWTKLYARQTHLTNEEKDRMKMVWGDKDEYKRDMVLYFNENQSYYTYPKEKESEGGWSGRDREFRIYRNFETEKRTDIIEMLGKTFVIEDSLKTPKWKVMNKIREIGGYMCMMAVTEDTIKNQKLTAWFADNISVSAGPELYSGLPGLILELEVNEGDIVVTAKKIELKPLTENINVPAKLKGKKIDNKKYDELLWTHIRDSQKARRDPFWAIQY
ncbi:GLPGLI family protein [Dyadobacter sp. 32]|uniref:GLPGLI family protein n=1 Tax=Dyadobacter sp. 32 TaxID=538966 RepID=UPI0011EFF372